MITVFTLLFLVNCASSASDPRTRHLWNLPLGNVSARCSTQFGEYVENLKNITDASLWALQMFDATSKIPSGLLYLNFGELGSFEECVDIKATNVTSSDVIYGKYCLGYVSPILNIAEVSLRDSIFSSLGDLAQTTRTQNPTWAICVPHACSANDVNLIVNYILSQVLNELTIGFQDNFCQTIDDVNEEFDAKAIVTISFLAILALIVLVSTVYEIYRRKIQEKESHLLVQAFSLYTNTKKVFKVRKYRSDQFPCLDGLKVISMVWVVAGHQYSVTLTGPIINSKDILTWVDNLYSMFVVSGTLSVDTFLVVTGCLLTYNFLKSRQKKAPFNIILYYVHRYLRLTPPLAVVVLVSATLLKYMGSGPRWPTTYMYFQNFCEVHWWSALLYVQNYVNVTNMCVGQTWYLSIDMQLYIISPFILYLLWKWPKIALPIIVFIILAILGTAFYIAWINNLIAILSNIYGNSYDYNNKYYLLTHTRAAPWFIGAILGYFVFQIKQNHVKFRLQRITVIILWMASFAVLLACVLGGHSTLRGKNYDKWGNVLHITFVRPVWSVAIALIILLCVSDYGGPVNWLLSRPIYQVFNKFTFSIYLTHVTLLYVKGFAVKAPKYFSEFDLMYEFWGTLWFSTGLSALLVFMVESPMIVLEKLLLGNFAKKPLPVVKGVENGAFEK